MVAKIQKSHGSMSGTLKYNQSKVDRQQARILGMDNIPGAGTPRDIERVFENYEIRNIRTDRVSFQMSINPDPDRPSERLTDEEAMDYARKLLHDLGYGEQPMVIYEHHDIQRTHYHVVSIRTDKNGKKIPDSFEHRRLQKLMEKYAEQFHYTIGNQLQEQTVPAKGKTTEQKVETLGKKKPARQEISTPALRFDPKGSDVRKQFTDIFNEALTYEFRTWIQFQTVMRSMGVETDFTENDEFHILFQGLDSRGNKTTQRISEQEMETPFFRQYQDRADACGVKREWSKEEKASRTKDRSRVTRTVAFCTEHSKTQKHLERMLEKKGITMTLSRDADGNIFGATFADATSKRTFKGSSLGKEFSLAALQEADRPETGRWAVNEELMRREWLERMKAERQERRLQHNLDMAARQRPLKESPLLKEPNRRDYSSKESFNFARFALQVLTELLGIPYRPVHIKGRPVTRRKTIKKIRRNGNNHN